MEIDFSALESYHRIKKMEVTGGFLDGLKINFDDNLNCIIGGRGTGKTTIIEFIRFALDKMPDQAFDAERYDHIHRLIENNLGNGTIHLSVETRDLQQLNFERQANSAPTITDAEGNILEIKTDSGILFNAEIYSQDEIEEIAANPYFQLELIDKFQPQKISELESRIRILKTELRQNAATITKVKASIEIYKEKTEVLPEIMQKLKVFQLSGNTNALPLQQEINQHSVREKEKACIDVLPTICQSTHDEIKALADVLSIQMDELFESDVINGPNKTLLVPYYEASKGVFTAAAAHLLEASTLFEKLSTQVPGWQEKLTALHLEQDKKYREVLNQSEKERTRAIERTNLLKKYNELLSSQKQSEKAAQELAGLETDRQKLLKQLSDLRDMRYACRQAVVEDLNKQLAPLIKITLEQFGNIGNYEKILKEALQGSGLQYNRLIPRAMKISPETLARLVHLQERNQLAEKLDLDENQTEKFLMALRGKESLYTLETVELYDKPAIELKDGNEYKDSASLSTGQRCSTILPILLLRSENPLLIDQPENNLDNAFIYNPIVTTLRTLKGIRQCIFVTHNPNIPVIGDAAGVFYMTSDGARGQIAKHGNVDTLKTEIAALLEGGEKAFKERYSRYGY